MSNAHVVEEHTPATPQHATRCRALRIQRCTRHPVSDRRHGRITDLVPTQRTAPDRTRERSGTAREARRAYGDSGRSPDSDPAARCAPLGTVTVTPTKAADRHVPPWLAPPVPTAWKLPERRLQQGSHDTRATATYTWRGRGGWADMSYRERPRRLAVIDHSGCGRRPPAERSGTWAKS
ncbi:MAG: hypothetical protein WDW38_003261 [Sanguina aurantia]